MNSSFSLISPTVTLLSLLIVSNQTISKLSSSLSCWLVKMSVQKKPIRLIVATCNKLGMGKDGKMPWSLPSEFQYFLDTTSRVSRPGKMNMMVWGKRNWYSKPDGTIPLPNTLHVVLSTEMISAPDHAHFLRDDFESAIRLAAEPPLAEMIETIWVIGGAQVYQTAMEHPWCDLLYITDVRAEFQCDVFFPEFDRKLFKLQEEFPGVPSEIKEENGIKYKCQVFKKETADIQ